MKRTPDGDLKRVSGCPFPFFYFGGIEGSQGGRVEVTKVGAADGLGGKKSRLAHASACRAVDLQLAGVRHAWS